ncbi:unnamed protein product [Cuscuta europaea]|uniref:Uncharacterized protein n=1 Tax=Cuscuta europaea TaxID=41803 RepID=A0A9P0Z2S9_CUSEU|nr:unnamed protein product [Cuscuta europaea]
MDITFQLSFDKNMTTCKMDRKVTMIIPINFTYNLFTFVEISSESLNPIFSSASLNHSFTSLRIAELQPKLRHDLQPSSQPQYNFVDNTIDSGWPLMVIGERCTNRSV